MELILRKYEESFLLFNNDDYCLNANECVGITYFKQNFPLCRFVTPKGYHCKYCLICQREYVFKEMIEGYMTNIGSVKVLHEWQNDKEEYETCDYLLPLNINQQGHGMFSGIIAPFVRFPLSKYRLINEKNMITQYSLNKEQRSCYYIHKDVKLNADPMYDIERYPGLFNATYVIYSCMLFCPRLTHEINDNVKLLNLALKNEEGHVNKWVETLLEHHTNNLWPWNCQGQAHPILCLKEALIFFIEDDVTLHRIVLNWYPAFTHFANSIKSGFIYATLEEIKIYRYPPVIQDNIDFRRVPLPRSLFSNQPLNLFYCHVCKVLKCKLTTTNSKRKKGKRGNNVFIAGVYWNYLTLKHHCYRKRSPGQPASHRYVLNPSTIGSYHCNAVCENVQFGKHVIIIQKKGYVHCLKCTKVCLYNIQWIMNGNICETCNEPSNPSIVCASCGAQVTTRSKSKKWVYCRLLMEGGYAPLKYKWICGRHKYLNIISEYTYVSHLIYNSIISEHVYS